eukprot:CAMPEP_0168614440 /NCGR_PEP_ID=MMETSP0449_2-20121227/3976_1 /TAXON_ID=1082188 /ORGANISM="Strombidium rassoulzadegani, Strain ras09" /LENGTH=179 /DNA_ID=CAMNT_0008655121 /DNA_START=231 /DNA_END=770 /DNA_ORIENTATION=-
MAAMMYLVCKVSDSYAPEATRNNYLYALSFFMGYMVGPAMHQIMFFYPEVLPQAVGYTSVVFACFSGIALFSKRRSYLFLGGVISSIMMSMMVYRLTSWLFGTGGASFGMGYMMVGLFVECLYVIYDTQMIIERAERGDKDVPVHTMMLFIDLFDMFLKIVQILIKLQEGDRKDKRRKD